MLMYVDIAGGERSFSVDDGRTIATNLITTLDDTERPLYNVTAARMSKVV